MINKSVLVKKDELYFFNRNSKLTTYDSRRSLYIANPAAQRLADEMQKKEESWSAKKCNLEMQNLIKKFPSEIFLQAWAWAVFGDYGQCLSKKQESIYKKKSVRHLRPLLRKLRGKSDRVRTLVRNEYFYHSGKYRQQYLLGLERLRRGNNGHFSAGVGASMYALELLKKGQLKRSRWYGQRALLHWNTFPASQRVNTGGVFYAFALAFSNKSSQAQAAFRKLYLLPHAKTSHRLYYRKRFKDLELIVSRMDFTT